MSFQEEKEDGACYVGQPVADTTRNFIESFKKAFENLVEKRKEFYLTDRCSQYIIRVRGGQYVYDKERAEEDARNCTIRELVTGSLDEWEDLINSAGFVNDLNEFLKREC